MTLNQEFPLHVRILNPEDPSRLRFELRLGDHTVYTDSCWSPSKNPDEQIDRVIGQVASRLGDLMRDGVLYAYDED